MRYCFLTKIQHGGRRHVQSAMLNSLETVMCIMSGVE